LAQIILGESEFKFFLKEGHCPSPKGDNSERVKMHRNFFKIFFSRTCRSKSIKLGTNYPLVKRIQVYEKKGQVLFKGEIITEM
jgi:hypothetical protein